MLFNISVFEDESKPKTFQTDWKQDDSLMNHFCYYTIVNGNIQTLVTKQKQGKYSFSTVKYKHGTH